MSRGEPFSGETVNYRKDGSEYYVEWDISPIRRTVGQISYFLSIQRNVTARKLAENQLKEMFREVEKSRNDLGSILNELRIGTAMTDEEGHVVFLSAAAQQMFAKPEVNRVDMPWKELFGLDREDTVQLQALIQKPPAERAKIPVHLDRTDGRRVWIEVDVKDDPRDARGKIFFFYDVTEVHDLRRLLDERAQFHDLLGKSKAMQLVYQQIRDVARVDSTVLIEGETGTGKELVARAIHFQAIAKINLLSR